MGAVPKRKISKGRKNRRRAQDGLKQPATSVCPKCKQVKRPHFKCEHCGHYGPDESSKTKSSSKEKAKSTKNTKDSTTKKDTKKNTKKVKPSKTARSNEDKT